MAHTIATAAVGGHREARPGTATPLPTRTMAATEAVSLLAATLGSQFLRFGFDGNGVQIGFVGLDYTEFSVLLSGLWFVLLLVVRAGRSPEDRFVSSPGAFRDLTRTTVVVVLVLAVSSAITQTEISRGYLLVAVPLGLVALVADRVAWRAWVRRVRERGRMCRSTLVIGPSDSVVAVRDLVDRDPGAGLRVVRTLVTDGPVGASARRAGPEALHARVEQLVDELGPDAVLVVGGQGDEFARELSWALEADGVQLLVAPQVGPVATQRLQTVTLAGHALIAVEPPPRSGLPHVAKRAFDVVASALGLVLAAPFIVLVALAVRLDSPGPAFFTQQRVGQGGRPFTIVKFRTMVPGADRLQGDLRAENEHGSGPLFKMRDDPRVTRLGRLLRRWSVDEVPQLVNVLLGHMSLVGPRPPLPSEVATYGDRARRRLLTKPGLTGPWQVGGRSDLPWEDGLHLDLLYVENWSLMGDLVVLARTVGAVLRARGAY
ncbi:sugar transferase [Curtobacterium sp. MCBD17_034]|uniref:sugar transferase n=1 Tax=unclassified Curtobacterium TaxID=257496 RepID=UPI000DA838A6|nr:MULTISPECIES: sugar transferase [unclassified Curtobacterium]PZF60232.1 sugar transferase [Curtobacterium sp. MCBD17_034]PZM34917.1 sugar transferase [Curtobacterium sp. MCBD17_031]